MATPAEEASSAVIAGGVLALAPLPSFSLSGRRATKQGIQARALPLPGEESINAYLNEPFSLPDA